MIYLHTLDFGAWAKIATFVDSAIPVFWSSSIDWIFRQSHTMPKKTILLKLFECGIINVVGNAQIDEEQQKNRSCLQHFGVTFTHW